MLLRPDYSTAAIARRLVVAPVTVRTHIATLLHELGFDGSGWTSATTAVPIPPANPTPPSAVDAELRQTAAAAMNETDGGKGQKAPQDLTNLVTMRETGTSRGGLRERYCSSCRMSRSPPRPELAATSGLGRRRSTEMVIRGRGR